VGQFVSGEQARERFRALLDRVDGAHDQMRALSSDEVGTAFRVKLAERLEAQHRSNRALMYRVFGQLADPPDELSPSPATVAAATSPATRPTTPTNYCAGGTPPARSKGGAQ
jgi:hypothetical protein